MGEKYKVCTNLSADAIEVIIAYKLYAILLMQDQTLQLSSGTGESLEGVVSTANEAVEQFGI